MLVMLARPSSPLNPFMVFDGKKLLALFRDENEIVKLSYISRKVLKALRLVDEVNITEMNEDSQALRQYKVKVIFDSQLKKKLKREEKFLY